MPPRYGVSIIPSASGRADPVAEARRAEELGFDLVAIWDHPHGEHPSLEAWTLMTWIAARTERISIVSDVLGLPFRHPSMIAKMAESLDRLSNGRFILGLGAGYVDAEFAAAGAPTRTAGEKITALEEALTIVRRLWTEPLVTFEGDHYRVESTRLEPKPGRSIPIWLGAYRPRALALAGRLADGWIPSMPYLPPSLVKPSMDRVRASAERAGRDPDTLELAYNIGVRVGGPPSEDPERQVAGEADAVIERLGELLDIGFDVLNLSIGGRREEQMERLGTEVLPALRQLRRGPGTVR